MCYVVTVAMKTGLDEKLAPIRAIGGVNLVPSGNNELFQLFGSGFSLFDAVKGGCSCDVYPARERDRPDRTDERLEEKYRRKGWSAAKTKRAVESALQAQRRKTLSRQHDLFAAAVGDTVSQTGELRLFSHWYSGSTRTEQLRCSEAIEIPLRDYLSAGGRFPADVVVTISDPE